MSADARVVVAIAIACLLTEIEGPPFREALLVVLACVCGAGLASRTRLEPRDRGDRHRRDRHERPFCSPPTAFPKPPTPAAPPPRQVDPRRNPPLPAPPPPPARVSPRPPP